MAFTVLARHPEGWKAVAAAIGTVVEDAAFDVTPEGISFRGMDPSHIALIDIFWPAPAFEKYQCDSATRFGIRVGEFTKLIRRADRGDAVEVSLEGSMLYVVVQGGYRRQYNLRLIESPATSTPLPKLNFNSKVVMPVQAFDSVLTDVQVVSDYVSIESTPGRVIFSGKGDSGEASVTLEAGSEGLEDLQVREESRAAYSLDYLVRVTKAAMAAGGSVSAEHSSKMPIRLEFGIAGSGRMHFYLAPRTVD